VALTTPFFLVLMIGFIIFEAGGLADSVVQHRLQGAYAFRKDAKAPSIEAQRGPSLARDALLQAYAPFALSSEPSGRGTVRALRFRL